MGGSKKIPVEFLTMIDKQKKIENLHENSGPLLNDISDLQLNYKGAWPGFLQRCPQFSGVLIVKW